jgi:exodeoxyribonuclease VII small subunit
MSAESPQPAPGFEANLDELEKIVKQLEAGELPLEQSLELFEKGMALSAACREQLEKAEMRVETLIRKGQQVVAQPFTK